MKCFPIYSETTKAVAWSSVNVENIYHPWSIWDLYTYTLNVVTTRTTTLLLGSWCKTVFATVTWWGVDSGFYKCKMCAFSTKKPTKRQNFPYLEDTGIQHSNNRWIVLVAHFLIHKHTKSRSQSVATGSTFTCSFDVALSAIANCQVSGCKPVEKISSWTWIHHLPFPVLGVEIGKLFERTVCEWLGW